MSIIEVYYNTLLGVTQGCLKGVIEHYFWGVPLHPMGCTTASVAEAPKRCIVTPFLQCS